MSIGISDKLGALVEKIRAVELRYKRDPSVAQMLHDLKDEYRELTGTDYHEPVGSE